MEAAAHNRGGFGEDWSVAYISTHLERQSVRQVSQVISCYERVETCPGHTEQMCCGTESPCGQSTYGVWFRDIFPPVDAPHKTSASEMTYIVSGGALNSTHWPHRTVTKCKQVSMYVNM